MKKNVLIIGWYGTETAGDKAILGGVCETMKAMDNSFHFHIVSSNPFYTRNTIEELALTDAFVIEPVYKKINQLLNGIDIVIMAGGPLMDLVEVFHLIRIFHMAQKKGIPAALVGIGFGPFRRKITCFAARTLIKMADRISVRERNAYDRFLEIGYKQSSLTLGADPAIIYVNKYRSAINSQVRIKPIHNTDNSQCAGCGKDMLSNTRDNPVIGLAIRDWPRKYAVELDDESYAERRKLLINEWIRIVNHLVDQAGYFVSLIPMNTFFAGTDDRAILLEIYHNARNKSHVTINMKESTVDGALAMINGCDVLIGMRYHSVVFGTCLGIPTLAIDYTQGGGKVSGYMDLLGLQQLVLPIEEVTCAEVTARVDQMLLSSSELTNLLLDKNSELIKLAQDVIIKPISALMEGLS